MAPRILNQNGCGESPHPDSRGRTNPTSPRKRRGEVKRVLTSEQLTLLPTIATSHLPPRCAPPHLRVTPPVADTAPRGSRKPWTSIAAISLGHPQLVLRVPLRCRLPPPGRPPSLPPPPPPPANM